MLGFSLVLSIRPVPLDASAKRGAGAPPRGWARGVVLGALLLLLAALFLLFALLLLVLLLGLGGRVEASVALERAGAVREGRRLELLDLGLRPGGAVAAVDEDVSVSFAAVEVVVGAVDGDRVVAGAARDRRVGHVPED